jgi:hypothetical protein
MGDKIKIFRKKPVEIQAIPLTAENAEYVARWCNGVVVKYESVDDPTDVTVTLDIPTLEGVMRGEVGDFIIKGLKGEFYPCKSDIFVESYDYVRDADETRD